MSSRLTSHGYNYEDDIDIVDGGWNAHEAYAMRRSTHTQQMTTKVAPAYDGRASFFALEDAIDNWRDTTELEAERRGPALRNRLEGDASQYKRLLYRELLKDPIEGLNYFKRFLRPHFTKGAQTVLLYSFIQSLEHNRGTMDLQRWMTRFQLTANRLIESWIDLVSDLDLNDCSTTSCS